MEPDFAERLAAPTPTPGGGAAAARVGLLASSLLRMIVAITLRKVGAGSGVRELEAAAAGAAQLAERFRRLEAEDVAAFEAFMTALRLPRTTAEEKAHRDAARRRAALRATRVPLDTMATSVAVLQLARDLKQLSEHTPLGAGSDLSAAVEFARAAFLAAECSVDANLPYLETAAATSATSEREARRSELDGLYGALRRQ